MIRAAGTGRAASRRRDQALRIFDRALVGVVLAFLFFVIGWRLPIAY
jgi:hypothetical protein